MCVLTDTREILQDHATGRRMPVHAGDALDAVVAAAAAAGFPPNVVLCAVPAVATSASNLVAALGQHQLEFIERRTIARWAFSFNGHTEPPLASTLIML
jgi:hypothetical protein